MMTIGFYNNTKELRLEIVAKISSDILKDIQSGKHEKIIVYFSDSDTYIRKSAYLAIGKIYNQNIEFQQKIILSLTNLMKEDDFKIRQTVINAAGEIGMTSFEKVHHFFDCGLFDTHHSVRNAVIGSVKKMGDKNPTPVFSWAKKYLHHSDKEVRREICHGIELRGRKYPQDILPMLQELEFDTTARVRNTLVHVIGQIAYKKGCLAIVIAHLKKWENLEVVEKAIAEIINVHFRYRNFSVLTQAQAIRYIEQHFDLKSNPYIKQNPQ